MQYILKMDELKIADVILQSGNSKFSWWIKKGTKSNYSHAMLYVGQSIIHALTDGVYSTNPQRIIIDSSEHLKVLRLNNITDKHQSIISSHARNLSGSLYNMGEAIVSPVFGKSNKDAISTGQFCSRLVSQSFIQAGISIVNNPDYCTPEDINNSSALVEVENCLREARTDDIEFANTNDPILENQNRTFKWLNNCRELFGSNNIQIQTIYDVATKLMEKPELDSKVCEYIKDSKYLDHFDCDKYINPHLYDLELFIQLSQRDSNDASKLLFEELNKEPDMIVRHSNNYFQSGFNYAHSGLKFHKLHVDLYRNLLQLSLERLEILRDFAVSIKQSKLIEICNYLLRYVKNIL